MAQLVITAVGADRPGLVNAFTGYLHDAGANIADSRMINLSGQFAILILVEAEDQTVISRIASGAVEAGSDIGLEVSVAGDKKIDSRVQGQPYRVKVFAMDQPGIVHRVTHLLHQNKVNIEELQTSLNAGSYSGTPLFSMDMLITIPRDVPVKQVRESLEVFCDELNCDVDMDAVVR
ncbi:MAG: hypothetical protein JKX85_05515 [Phycisphaeraceae bacterium]|nr:hypothetical protein [Phycisphaeraceae bacterium]